MNEWIYIEAVHLLFWTFVSTVGLSERGLNLGDFTCSLTAICCFGRALVLGFWGLETKTNLKWMNIYIEVVHLLFWTCVSTVGLSERGLNLAYFTCSLTAIWYVLCRELVLGFWGLEPETNLKWMNIYWSYAPPILDVRPDRRSVWEVSELTCFICNFKYAVFCRIFFKGFEVWSYPVYPVHPVQPVHPVNSVHPIHSLHPVHVLFSFFGNVVLLPIAIASLINWCLPPFHWMLAGGSFVLRRTHF